VEEMTKAVLEAGTESAAEHTAATIPLSALAVPTSLHASLMARLDRLGPAKEVAQIGAAVGREFSHALLQVVVRKPETELQSALDRLVTTGLLFRQGVPPHASYLFKHALVQDAAYGTLLREPRRVLHARIAETLESQFGEVADNQPEVLARHCTEAGLIEKAAGLWGKAGQRSLARSALVEAAEQLTHALNQIDTLPATPMLRREQINFQVSLITPLMHVKGFAAPETMAAEERALQLIEQAEALAEPPEDPLLLFSVLYGFWVANYAASNGPVMRELAARFLDLAEKQGATAPLMVGHRLVATSLFHTGEIAEGRAHFDSAIALYDNTEHRSLATRFGQDVGVVILSWRAVVLWLLGYPAAALADVDAALENAREAQQATTLMYAQVVTSFTLIHCGNYARANAQSDEVVATADEKGTLFWKAQAMVYQGCVSVLTSKASDAIQTINAGITAWRSTGASLYAPLWLSYLAKAYAELGQFDEAWRWIGEAMSAVATTKERWCEPEVYRTAGEIASLLSQLDAAKAEGYFQRALTVARKQQAKSWELRAAMSLARLWRDQGKVQQARELLAPVYGWFTEGFDTRDLKEAKALLEELGT
jgi:predicted ATPase